MSQAELRTVAFRKQRTQRGKSFHRHMRLPELLQALDDQAAHASRRCHRSWSCAFENDLAGSDL